MSRRRGRRRCLPVCLITFALAVAVTSWWELATGLAGFAYAGGDAQAPADAMQGLTGHAFRSRSRRMARGAWPAAEATVVATAMAPTATTWGPYAAVAVQLLACVAPVVWLAVSGSAVLYVVISFTEYIYHRYVQHLDLNREAWYKWARKSLGAPTLVGDFHMLHHRETLNSMQIDPLPLQEWSDVTVHRGTAATWLSFVKMVCCVMLPSHPLLCMLGWSGPFAALAVAAATLLHLMAYNALHPQLHGLPDVSMEQGPPSLGFGFQDSVVADWLRAYHVVHHRTYAKRNFNVCCPLVDHLLGTHAADGVVAKAA